MNPNKAESYLRFVPKKDSDVLIDIPNGSSLDRPKGPGQSSDDNSKSLRQRGSLEGLERIPLATAIKPFQKKSFKLMSALTKELKVILAEQQGWRILWLICLNLIGSFVLFIFSGSTNSLALTALSYLTIFDLFSLFTCMLSLWVALQKPSPAYSYGYERFEVLAVFSGTILAMFGALFIAKESSERLLMPPEIITDNLFPVTCFGLLLHLLVTYGVTNKAFNQVCEAATANWLQDAIADFGHSICGVAPFLGKALIQRINPLVLVGVAGAGAVLLVDGLVNYNKSYISDSLCAIFMACVIWATMLPLSLYSGQILLQTCPSGVMGQLDKCLREASTLDGVLEFRHEHFWTVSFGRMAGSLHVRIRRDANEQMVLAHVTNKLSSHVPYLTVQVFKDEWMRAASGGTKLVTLPSSLAASYTRGSTLTNVNLNGQNVSNKALTRPSFSQQYPAAGFETSYVTDNSKQKTVGGRPLQKLPQPTPLTMKTDVSFSNR